MPINNHLRDFAPDLEKYEAVQEDKNVRLILALACVWSHLDIHNEDITFWILSKVWVLVCMFTPTSKKWVLKIVQVVVKHDPFDAM